MKQQQIHQIIIALCFLIIILIIAHCAQGGTPGAHTRPGPSQVGKSDQPDPGGTFRLKKKIEHNVLFPDRDGHKLIPELGINSVITHGNRIFFGINALGNRVFNIITIMYKTPTKQSLALSYTQTHKVIHIPRLGISTRLGHNLFLALPSKFVLLVRSQVCARNIVILV